MLSINSSASLCSNRDFVLNHLKDTLSSALNGTLECPIMPYMMGGSGHVYRIDEIDIMKQLVNLAAMFINCVVSKYHDTPLHLAYFHGNKNMVDFLIQNGADTSARRYNGDKPQ